VEFQDPFQAPPGFVQYVGQTITAGKAPRTKPVPKLIGLHLIGHQEAGGGITTGDKVFELITGIVPTTGSVDTGRIWSFPEETQSVELVTKRPDMRIVPTPLGSDEIDDILLPAGIGANGKGRAGQTLVRQLKGIRTFRPDFRKVSHVIMRKRSPGTISDLAGIGTHGITGTVFQDQRGLVERAFTQDKGSFRHIGRVPLQVDPDLGGGLGTGRKEDWSQEHY
jgi:hypothetical protein